LCYITGFVTRLTRRVSLVEQEVITLPEYLSSPPVFSGVSITRSLVLYVCFVDRCLSFSTFSFGNCVVCSSSIYGFWLPLWYLQNLLISNELFLLLHRYTPNGAWSTIGSRLVNSYEKSTICEYDHTTNFAVLMSPGRTVCIVKRR